MYFVVQSTVGALMGCGPLELSPAPPPYNSADLLWFSNKQSVFPFVLVSHAVRFQ